MKKSEVKANQNDYPSEMEKCAFSSNSNRKSVNNLQWIFNVKQQNKKNSTPSASLRSVVEIRGIVQMAQQIYETLMRCDACLGEKI